MVKCLEVILDIAGQKETMRVVWLNFVAVFEIAQWHQLVHRIAKQELSTSSAALLLLPPTLRPITTTTTTRPVHDNDNGEEIILWEDKEQEEEQEEEEEEDADRWIVRAGGPSSSLIQYPKFKAPGDDGFLAKGQSQSQSHQHSQNGKDAADQRMLTAPKPSIAFFEAEFAGGQYVIKLIRHVLKGLRSEKSVLELVASLTTYCERVSDTLMKEEALLCAVTDKISDQVAGGAASSSSSSTMSSLLLLQPKKTKTPLSTTTPMLNGGIRNTSVTIREKGSSHFFGFGEDNKWTKDLGNNHNNGEDDVPQTPTLSLWSYGCGSSCSTPVTTPPTRTKIGHDVHNNNIHGKGNGNENGAGDEGSSKHQKKARRRLLSDTNASILIILD